MHPLPLMPITPFPKQLATTDKLFRFRKPACPQPMADPVRWRERCDRPEAGSQKEGQPTSSGLSLRHTAECPRSGTGFSMQPVIDAIKAGINARYYFTN